MPANPDPDASWQQLGKLLTRRRIEIDPRYSNRQTFVDERGIKYRTVSDIEKGRRSNYEDATIDSVEVAYRLAPGAVRDFLDGETSVLKSATGDATAPAPGPFPVPQDEPGPDVGERVLFPEDTPLDDALRAAWRLPLTEETRLKLVAAIRAIWRLDAGEDDRKEMIWAVIEKAGGPSGPGNGAGRRLRSA